MKKPLFVSTDNTAVNRNFQSLTNKFAEMFPGVDSRPITVTLVVGDNVVVPPVVRPRGRILTFQSAASNLFDKGLNAAGNWVINASSACTVTLYFF